MVEVAVGNLFMVQILIKISYLPLQNLYHIFLSRTTNAIYLDTKAQKSLGYSIHRLLNYDSYTRKSIGYLYAIEVGSFYIKGMCGLSELQWSCILRPVLQPEKYGLKWEVVLK